MTSSRMASRRLWISSRSTQRKSNASDLVTGGSISRSIVTSTLSTLFITRSPRVATVVLLVFRKKPRRRRLLSPPDAAARVSPSSGDGLAPAWRGDHTTPAAGLPRRGPRTGREDHLRPNAGALSSHQDCELCARHPTQRRNFLARSKTRMAGASNDQHNQPNKSDTHQQHRERHGIVFQPIPITRVQPCFKRRFFLDAKNRGG